MMLGEIFQNINKLGLSCTKLRASLNLPGFDYYHLDLPIWLINLILALCFCSFGNFGVVSLVWFGRFGLLGLIWFVWLDRFCLVGVVWYVLFGRFGRFGLVLSF